MDDMQLLIDLHRRQSRQGPGSDEASALALQLAALDATAPLAVADLGCGTGASTLMLARALNAEITAVDFLPEFLDELQQRAEMAGLAGCITPLCAAMEALPFAEGQFDLIWAEGAIYNIGFATGVAGWRRFLKPGGRLVVSEITWTTNSRPAAIESHWLREYPEVDTASAKLGVLEREGYAPMGYFVLPETGWLDDYYRPLEAGFATFLERHSDSEAARALVAAEREEIALYTQFRRYYSYGFYVAERVA
jgi:SAM-dependent methyltransferase